jgi:hypothetical protein
MLMNDIAAIFTIMNMVDKEKIMSTTVMLLLSIVWVMVCLAVPYSYAMRKLDKE